MKGTIYLALSSASRRGKKKQMKVQNCRKGKLVEVTVIECNCFNKVLDKWARKKIPCSNTVRNSGPAFTCRSGQSEGPEPFPLQNPSLSYVLNSVCCFAISGCWCQPRVLDCMQCCRQRIPLSDDPDFSSDWVYDKPSAHHRPHFLHLWKINELFHLSNWQH